MPTVAPTKMSGSGFQDENGCTGDACAEGGAECGVTPSYNQYVIASAGIHRGFIIPERGLGERPLRSLAGRAPRAGRRRIFSTPLVRFRFLSICGIGFRSLPLTPLMKEPQLLKGR